MRKALLVWWRTYTSTVLHPAFLMFTLGLPLTCLVAGGVAAYFILKSQEGDPRPIGIVDLAGVLVAADEWRPTDPLKQVVNLIALESEPEAESALKAGDIQAYYLVPADYIESGTVTEVAASSIADRVRDQVRVYLSEGLLKTSPVGHRARITGGTILLHRSLADQRELSFQLGLQWGLAAFVLAAFYVINSSSSSDMLHALKDEEDRGTIEIALTSLTPEQLLAGKVGGIVSAGLTQFIVWAIGAGLPAFLILRLFNTGSLGLTPWPLASTLALCLALLFPAYVLNACGVIIISSLGNLAGRGEQIVSLLTGLGSVFTGPLTLIAIASPDNPVAVALSLLPITSPLIMVTRYVQVVVPAWQIGLAVALVWGAMGLGLFAAARLYRAAWLMRGQKNWLRSAWVALRS